MTTVTQTLPTFDLRAAGQSPWLDQISRQLIQSGKLSHYIRNQGLLGVTSNPTIFEKAINQKNSGYESDIRKLIRQGRSVFDIYDTLTVSEIRTACDLFREVYRESGGEHGYVSLEVMPSLARDPDATVREAVRLFRAVNRPNVMIKVPATTEGVAAIRRLIAMGININATLIFSVRHYQAVAHAYLDGLHDRLAQNEDVKSVHSVASVFVSRFDTLIDKKLEGMAAQCPDQLLKEGVLALQGKSAIANSKIIFQEFKQIIASEKARVLLSRGAHVQKLLWGSTSTKNPFYPDLLYVEPLVGAETVNTMPMETLEAFLDHGHVSAGSAEENVEEVFETKRRLKDYGIDLEGVGEVLQEQGLKAFADSFDSLMRSIELARETALAGGKKRGAGPFISYTVGTEKVAKGIDAALKGMEKKDFLKRFLAKDATLWKKDPDHVKVINNRLGWLHVADWMLGRLYEIDCLREEILRDKIKDVVLLGMGGSSLAPEVMSLICKPDPRAPKFHILDTTSPASILEVEKAVSLRSTLFVVASKSGSTIETLSQWTYFHDRIKKLYGAKADPEKVGSHFIAITDERSSLEKLAYENRFRRIFINPSDIGGRYSALSYFGLVPASLIGVDVRRLLRSAVDFFEITRNETHLQHNPGIYLGAVMAQFASLGKDKLTFWMSKSLTPFGAWLEQLIAESTGKEGKGIIPVEGEEASDPDVYDKDRLFVVMKLKNETCSHLMQKVKAVKKAGFPVVEFEYPDVFSLGGEFLRWEIATAVCSALMEINPFDEPNVKEAKDCTSKILAELKAKGRLEGLKKFASIQSKISVKPFFSKVENGAYLAILVYGPRTALLVKGFNKIREHFKTCCRIPVLVGFGPRYLHSIGQLYKGGPLKGIFVEVLAEAKKNVKIPGAGYGFGDLIQAQALGDLQALKSKGVPVLTINMEDPTEKNIERLQARLFDCCRK